VGGCVAVDADELDGIVTEVMLQFLGQPDNLARLTPTTDDAEVEEARLAVARIRAEADDLADAVGRGALSTTLAARAEPGIRARLSDAEAKLRDLTTPGRLKGPLDLDDLRRSWDAAPTSARREVVKILCSKEVLGELRILRTGGRGQRRNAPIAERIEWRRA
jgi:hypothetical protein